MKISQVALRVYVNIMHCKSIYYVQSKEGPMTQVWFLSYFP